MANAKNPAPPESLRNHLEFRNGLLYWKDIKENAHALKFSKGLHIGARLNKSSKYSSLRFKGERYQTHRVVYWLVTGEWPSLIDHVDGDRHNNLFSNLEASDHKKNKANSKTSKGYEIVQCKDGTTSYRPRITIDDACYYLGSYKDELTAQYKAWKARRYYFDCHIPIPPLVAELLGVQQ